ncbi:MAG: hypothetical protein ACLR6J_05475 [Parabacteroides merdae]
MTDIENALKNQDITSEMRKKLTDLQNTIDDNDNNYVMIAKLKNSLPRTNNYSSSCCRHSS